jgi:hypothetical protein
VVVELVDLEHGRTVCVTSFEIPSGSEAVMPCESRMTAASFGASCIKPSSTLSTTRSGNDRSFGFSRQRFTRWSSPLTRRCELFQSDVQSIGQRPYKSRIEQDYLENQRSTTSS